MTDQEKLEKLYYDMERLRNEMSKIDILVGRIDITIDKLTEISQNISNLVAVQGNKIDAQEKFSAGFTAMLETRREQFSNELQTIINKIDDLEKEIIKEQEIIKSDVKNLKLASNDMKVDLKEVRDAFKEKSGGWKMIGIIAGAASAIAALVFSALQSGIFSHLH